MMIAMSVTTTIITTTITAIETAGDAFDGRMDW